MKTRGLRSLKMAQKALQSLFIDRAPIQSASPTTTSSEDDSAFRKPLCRRGYSVQLEYSDQASSAMSQTSSHYMQTNEACMGILNKSDAPSHAQQSVVIDRHQYPTAPFYIPYTPTRSDIDQDYLEASGREVDVTSCPINYDREQLHETIERLRASLHRPSADHSENTDDSGVVLALSQNHSPSSSWTAPPLSTSQDISGDEIDQFDLGISPRESQIVQRSNDALRRNRVDHGLIIPSVLPSPDIEIRCQALIKEFRHYKSGLSAKGRLQRKTTMCSLPVEVIKKPPLESEC
jgi:hypothetical protein